MKRVTVTKDSVTQVVKSIYELVGKQVLIGIPDSTSSRDEEEGEPINNATLGYIHEFGAPDANIPARPFLIPGVQKAEDKGVERLAFAAKSALSGDRQKAILFMREAGLIAEMSVKDEISTADYEPLKPATIRARRYARGTKSMRASEKKYLELIAGGMSPGDAQSEAGIRPLINKGELRNSITHVLRKK
jgi:hypothetical protein